MAYRPEFISAVEEEQRATIARLTAELEAARVVLEMTAQAGSFNARTAENAIARAEAAEALLGAAYRAALEDVAKAYCLGYWYRNPDALAGIRALPVPADLAARLAKEAGE